MVPVVPIVPPVVPVPPLTTSTPVVSPVTAAPQNRPKAQPSPAKSKEGLEDFIGGNLLNKIGIGILIIGIGIFVKYAIDKDWIGPVGRVMIGLLSGGILLGVAHWLRKAYAAFSSVLLRRRHRGALLLGGHRFPRIRTHQPNGCICLDLPGLPAQRSFSPSPTTDRRSQFWLCRYFCNALYGVQWQWELGGAFQLHPDREPRHVGLGLVPANGNWCACWVME